MNKIYEIVEISTIPHGLTLFCDTETDGLYGDVTVFQCHSQNWNKVKIVLNPNLFLLRKLVLNSKTIWHNSSYDFSCIDVEPTDFEDTLLLARLQFPKLSRFSLDNVMIYVLHKDVYNEYNLDKSVLQKSKWIASELTQDQLIYCSLDVLYLSKVFDAMKSYCNNVTYCIDKQCILASMRFQRNGLYVDKERLNLLKSRLENAIDEKNVGFNVNSYQQVRQALNVESSDKIFLYRLKNTGNTLANNVLILKSLRKSLSTVEKYETATEKSDRIYGKFAPIARSGRFTCSNDNLQQIPRNLKILFSASSESRCLVYCDYPQLELRTIACDLEINVMLHAFRNNIDLHDVTAEKFFGSGFTKNQRSLAKQLNFLLLYGGSAGMLCSQLLIQDIVMTHYEALEFIKKWYRIFPEIKIWHDKMKIMWQAQQIYETGNGKRYFGIRVTDQINIRNQGTASEVAKLALINLDNKLKNQEEIKLLNFIHDSFILECDNTEESITKASDMLADSMTFGWYEGIKCLKIKDVECPLEVLAGKNWGDIEKGVYSHAKNYNIKV